MEKKVEESEFDIQQIDAIFKRDGKWQCGFLHKKQMLIRSHLIIQMNGMMLLCRGDEKEKSVRGGPSPPLYYVATFSFFY
jgi:hypothetical protein